VEEMVVTAFLMEPARVSASVADEVAG